TPLNDFFTFVRVAPAIRAVPSSVMVKSRSSSEFPITRKVLLVPANGEKGRCIVSSDLPGWLTVEEDSEPLRTPAGARRFILQIRQPPSDGTTSEAVVEFRVGDANATTVTLPVKLFHGDDT